jgi:hypothetical protein
VSLAGEHVLPVAPALAPLLPGGALRRGSSVGVEGAAGATSLALALLAEATATGSWAAAVGVPSIGLAAAAELGVTLGRLVMVADPGPRSWATTTATLVDAFDLVLVRPSGRVRAGDARRLAARARERGAVVVHAGGAPWPEAHDVRLTVESARWEGLGHGHGHLQARRVDVVAGGRRAAGRPTRVALWLPGPDGALAACAVEAVDDAAGAAASTRRTA